MKTKLFYSLIIFTCFVLTASQDQDVVKRQISLAIQAHRYLDKQLPKTVSDLVLNSVVQAYQPSSE